LINGGFLANDDLFYERLADTILQPDDDMVGLMTDADSLHHTVTMARLFKQRSPRTRICLGGPASSPISDLLLERFPFIDMVVRGEGELTFTEMLQSVGNDRPPSEVQGLTWRSDEKIVHNPDRPVLSDLDLLPIPAFEAHGMDPDAPIYLDVGRGCPFKCHFCATAPFWNRRFRMKSMDRIVSELTLLRDRYHRNHVGFAHDIFTANKRWTLEFCRQLIDRPLDMTWACSTRTDIIDREVLEAMAAAGCVEIYYGVESGSPQVQSAIHKHLDLDRAREVVETTASAGIRPVTGFIVGYPMETRKTFNQTLERFFEFLQVGGYRAHLFTLCPFQEAPMYQDGHKINRRAAYFEMPLTISTAAAGEKLRAEHPDIFTSLYRFDTPEIPAELIDGSEEIASRLVVFKALWPRLLEHYATPMEWYERWIGWIRQYNAEHRPSATLPCHGEIDDMMTFIEQELVRLDLTDSPISSLLQYEREKLRAARELTNFPGREPEAKRYDDLSADTVLTRGCDYLLSPLEHDLGALLRGGEVRSAAGRVAVFAKIEGEDMLTLQVGARTARILGRARRPRRIRDLVKNSGDGGISTDGEALDETMRIVRATTRCWITSTR
jgi:tRNA A37 methylthiotransferase MiaB